MVEPVHRQIKIPYVHFHLPWVIQGLRVAPKEKSAVSSSKLVIATPPVSHGQPLDVLDRPHVRQAPPTVRPASNDDANTPPAHLKEAWYVYMWRGGQLLPMANYCAAPYLWWLKGGPRSFSIKVGYKTETVSLDRLKANTGLYLVSPVAAAKLGWPAKAAA